MPKTLLNFRGLDSTRATTQDRPNGVSNWPEPPRVEDLVFEGEALALNASGLIISESFTCYFKRPTVQILFSPQGQDTFIQSPESAVFLNWLRNQYIHVATKDVPMPTAALLRSLVTYSYAPGPALESEFGDELFRRMLLAALSDEPIEDGITHPAENLIQDAHRRNASRCMQTLTFILNEMYRNRPSLSASLLRCIGRMRAERLGPWGIITVKQALFHEDVEVRDAAIRALEKWGTGECLQVLWQYRDSEDWLNDYVRQVIYGMTIELS